MRPRSHATKRVSWQKFYLRLCSLLPCCYVVTTLTLWNRHSLDDLQIEKKKKIIIWWYLNRYFRIFIQCYYKISTFWVYFCIFSSFFPFWDKLKIFELFFIPTCYVKRSLKYTLNFPRLKMSRYKICNSNFCLVVTLFIFPRKKIKLRSTPTITHLDMRRCCHRCRWHAYLLQVTCVFVAGGPVISTH